jgi:hypothetical protein
MAYQTKTKKPYYVEEPYGLPRELDEKDKFQVEPKNEYDEQADKFLSETGTKFKVKYLKHDKYFPSDDEARDIYRFTLTKDGKTYSGKFGQSISNSDYGNTPPRPYDVLSSLGSDVGHGDNVVTFEEFCDEYGYDEDSRKAHKVFKAVEKEKSGLRKLYSQDELYQMSEIQ